MSRTPFVLITGGLGFIGSHTAIVLLEKGYNVLIVDNCSNTSEENINGLKELSSKLSNNTQLRIETDDLLSKESIDSMFSYYNIHSIIHFAALKSVGESIQQPLLYYQNNITGTLNLLETAIKYKVKNFIFSSSATVYGDSLPPFEETSTVGHGITNPYGRTKYMMEEILRDVFKSSTMSIILLRYFNPIGAHPSGLLGEIPKGVPNNLFPYLLDVAEKKRMKLHIFGNDYLTNDGTCIRDYIHVMDIAEGHYSAFKLLETVPDKLFDIFNLGTGKGTSVLELIHTFEEVNNIEIPYEIVDRRPGDVPISYAFVMKAKELLNWEAQRSLKDMCIDGWNFRNKK
jgi:UDP-glucose 4-epimerase